MTGGCKEREGGRMKEEGVERRKQEGPRERISKSSESMGIKRMEMGKQRIQSTWVTMCVSHSRWVRHGVREVDGRAYNLEAEEVTLEGVHCSVMCYDPSHTYTQTCFCHLGGDIVLTHIHSWRI